MRNIVVLPYDPRWPLEYARIRDEIWPSVRRAAIAVEHVGSTAVEGLPAKPIIDMNIVVRDGAMEEIILLLAPLGYIHEGNLGIEGREAFRYESKPHLMKHHLYACYETSPEHMRMVAFRDYLRTHPEDRERYGVVKLEMAQKHPHDIKGYIMGKEPMIMEIYEKCGIAPWK